MIIGKKFSFDYAHWLPQYPGKCQRLHGHTATLFVEIEGEINKETGMVMDYRDLTAIVKRGIDGLDHYCLNDIVTGPPTCERTILWIRAQLEPKFEDYGVKLYRLELHEGNGGYAIWKKTI